MDRGEAKGNHVSLVSLGSIVVFWFVNFLQRNDFHIYFGEIMK